MRARGEALINKVGILNTGLFNDSPPSIYPVPPSLMGVQCKLSGSVTFLCYPMQKVDTLSQQYIIVSTCLKHEPLALQCYLNLFGKHSKSL